MQTYTAGVTFVNRYQVLSALGRGGMGTVYLARDLTFTSRYVALKQNGDCRPAAQAQFRLEAELLARLRHPYLPAVTDHFVTPQGQQFMVMEYIAGETLEERIERLGMLPESEVVAWGKQVLEALAYLHAQTPPIIHRDVKPANIRITPEGQAVLVDFGIAKCLVPGQATATIAHTAGSPGFAPPEQYAGGTDQRSDLYALGATLYFALTGQEPPPSPLLAAGALLVRPRQLNPALTVHTEAVIMRAMQPDSTRRFQSAAEMQAALGERPSAARFRPGSGSRFRLSGFWRVALLTLATLVAVTVLALGINAGWSFFNQGGGTPTPTSSPTVTTTSPVVVTTAPVAGETPTPTPRPGESPRPTATLQPTATPTPTRTPCPPTATPTPEPPTSTPAPETPGGGGGTTEPPATSAPEH